MSYDAHTIEKQQGNGWYRDHELEQAAQGRDYEKAKAIADKLTARTGIVHRVLRRTNHEVYRTTKPDPQQWFKLGRRVEFICDADRYPLTVVKAGETGVITFVGDRDDSENLLEVRLDKHHEGLDEWGNVLHYPRECEEWPQLVHLPEDSPRPEPVPGDPDYRTPEQQKIDDLRSDLLEAVSTLSDLMSLYGGEPASDDEETLEVWDAARAVVAKHTGGLLGGRPEYRGMVNWTSEQFVDCGIEMPAEQYRMLCVERTRLHPDTTLDQISPRLARKFSKILVDAMTPAQIFLLGRGLHPNNIIDANQCMIEAMDDLRIPRLAGTWASTKMSDDAFDIARENGYFLAEHLK